MLLPRLLLVEDDHGLRDALARGLRDHDFEVVTAADGATALRMVDSQTVDGQIDADCADTATNAAAIDAAVVDIGLPDSDGRDVCHAMRAAGVDVPVVFLTARDALVDRLSGFEAGGDDYLTKPCHVAELAARLRAALRRTDRSPTATASGLRLDPVRHVLAADSVEVALTPTEFRLLARLMREPGAVVRRHGLLAAGWPAGAQVGENTLDQYLAKLRRKLRATGTRSRIETLRGIGYRFARA